MNPPATYRVQLTGEFGFYHASQIVRYLYDLGVGDLYASPVLQARRGSRHGYDVIDPTRLNQELGGAAGFRRLAGALRRAGMGLLLDIVPNHMAMGSGSPWWMDVLTRGPKSRYARFFDIDWNAPGLEGKVLLPILGGPYGDVLERGELRVELAEDGRPMVRYLEHVLPLAPESYAELPPDQLPRLLNGDPGDPESFRLLDEVLARQHYQLSYWRAASRRIDYRRFFDITDLVALRQERPEVFEATHRLVLGLVREDRVTGLRADHVDGLREPFGYLQRLRARVGGSRYLVVEKILAPDERLPSDWPVAGTTGYDFLNQVNDVFVDPAGLERLQEWAGGFTGVPQRFERIARRGAREVMRDLFGSEVTGLTRRLARLAAEDRHGRDLTEDLLAEALVEVSAALPVYRTYVRSPDVRGAGRRYLLFALREASRRLSEETQPALRFLRRVLLLEFDPSATEAQREAWLSFVMRWQQLTGPVTAKGVEDTALYRWSALISRTEVGSEPGRPPLDVEGFHRANGERRRRWPGAMLATSTHDTKRSEDVRARLDVLSEIPDGWADAVARWSRLNRDLFTEVDGVRVPDPTEELFLYQTLLGVWPMDGTDDPSMVERLQTFMAKAAREAKVYTSWTDQNEHHERALFVFVAALLQPDHQRFRRDFLRFHARVAFHGALNSLSQVVLKATSPGVPDFYQGTELWNLRLVDPDNRASVNYEYRMQLLEELDRRASSDRPELLLDLMKSWYESGIKLFVTSESLRFRRDHPRLFQQGAYVPLDVRGPKKDHVVAFARRYRREWALVVVPRLTASLTEPGTWPLGPEAWVGTSVSLPDRAPGEWSDVYTNGRVSARSRGRVRIADALNRFPVGLLTLQEADTARVRQAETRRR